MHMAADSIDIRKDYIRIFDTFKHKSSLWGNGLLPGP